MTCIVGLVQNDVVYVGGDSAGSDGTNLTERADLKVFRNGDFVMGFTSSFRMGQLLAFNFDPPKRDAGTDVMAYMVTYFIDAARKCMKDGGYMRIVDSAERGGTFLVGYQGKLFRIQEDFQVSEAALGFDACGSGQEIALGSLWSTRLWSDPVNRLGEALRAAEKFCAHVRGPFVFKTMPADA